MTLAIIMDLMGCINIPSEDRNKISGKGEFEKTCSEQVFEYALEFAPVILIRGFDMSGEKSNRCLEMSRQTRDRKRSWAVVW